MDPSASNVPSQDSPSTSDVSPQSAPPGVQDAAELAGSVQLQGTGLRVERRFTEAGVHPFDEVRWEKRTASIGNEKGETVFEQTDCEIPAFWSQMATNVVVSKYFRGARQVSSR